MPRCRVYYTRTRTFLEHFTLPLELDTDGIWSAFPSSFSHYFKLAIKINNNTDRTSSSAETKRVRISRPVSMLSHRVYLAYHTQHQHQQIPTHTHTHIYTHRTQSNPLTLNAMGHIVQWCILHRRKKANRSRNATVCSTAKER